MAARDGLSRRRRTTMRLMVMHEAIYEQSRPSVRPSGRAMRCASSRRRCAASVAATKFRRVSGCNQRAVLGFRLCLRETRLLLICHYSALEVWSALRESGGERDARLRRRRSRLARRRPDRSRDAARPVTANYRLPRAPGCWRAATPRDAVGEVWSISPGAATGITRRC